MGKQIVHYRPHPDQYISPGVCARVFPVDHPSVHVSNTQMVVTSPVLFHNRHDGSFETMNTTYIPVKE